MVYFCLSGHLDGRALEHPSFGTDVLGSGHNLHPPTLYQAKLYVCDLRALNKDSVYICMHACLLMAFTQL